MGGAYYSADSTSPARQAVAIVKSNTTIIPTTRAVWVGTGGTLHVVMAESGNVSFVNVANGTMLPIQVVQVLADTTAADMVAIY